MYIYGSSRSEAVTLRFNFKLQAGPQPVIIVDARARPVAACAAPAGPLSPGGQWGPHGGPAPGRL